jgi:hypothetical protein
MVDLNVVLQQYEQVFQALTSLLPKSRRYHAMKAYKCHIDLGHGGVSNTAACLITEVFVLCRR